jgi:hypothetical protein
MLAHSKKLNVKGAWSSSDAGSSRSRSASAIRTMTGEGAGSRRRAALYRGNKFHMTRYFRFCITPFIRGSECAIRTRRDHCSATKSKFYNNDFERLFQGVSERPPKLEKGRRRTQVYFSRETVFSKVSHQGFLADRSREQPGSGHIPNSFMSIHLAELLNR